MLLKPVSRKALQKKKKKKNKHVDKSIPKLAFQPGKSCWSGTAAVLVHGCHI